MKNVLLNEPKANSRQWIITQWRKIKAKESLPVGHKFITMCNKVVINEKSEYNQYVKSGFCRRGDYVGVDTQRQLIDENKQKFPMSKFIHGNISKVVEQLITNKVRVGAINLDTCSSVEKGVKLLKQTIDEIEKGDDHSIFIALTVMQIVARRKEIKINETPQECFAFIKELFHNYKGWSINENYFDYISPKNIQPMVIVTVSKKQ